MRGLTDRTFEPERMDDPAIPRAELEEAFRFIRRVNRRLGGAKALLQALDRITRGWPRGRELSMIDLGAGCADIPLAVAAWADRRRRPVRIVAVDNHEKTLAIARDAVASEPRITLAEADARRLLDIFDPGAFDVAHAGMFLHHLADIEVVTVLRIMQRLARAVVWNDLTRDAVSKLGVRLLTIGTPAVVRHDAIVSVAKGFTRREAIDLAKRAGLEQIEYRRYLFGRFVVVGSA
ncbi:MAG: methyltransferase domain-containing protein [Phycisphaerales bacterium]|nr:methyltransferase domain-containing protein [Phycisphaerales bacterium]